MRAILINIFIYLINPIVYSLLFFAFWNYVLAPAFNFNSLYYWQVLAVALILNICINVFWEAT